ncbi:MAG: PilZ domain-containing protein [Lachnospiraceae bacterium]|nr:PilZ domain-containing protein [Lachnospiraceae bacterium]
MANTGKDALHRIDELTGNVSVIVKGSDSEVEFETDVLEESPEGCLDLVPILYEEKVVSFKVEDVKVTVRGTIGGMRIIFEAEKIVYLKRIDGVLAHRVYCNHVAKCINMREFKRFSLGCEGTAQIGPFLKANCIVKDVSFGGLAVGISGNLQIPVTQVLKVSIYPEIPGAVKTVNVNGVTVRSTYDEKKDVTNLGIKVTDNSPQLRSLVTRIQREELKKINHDNNLL